MNDIIVEMLEHNGIGFDWTAYEQEIVKPKQESVQTYIKE